MSQLVSIARTTSRRCHIVSPDVQKQIIDLLNKLSAEQQRRVVEYARTMTGLRPPGTPGRDLAHLAGSLDDASAKEMMEIIERDCERIDPDDWR